ncbi:Heat shock protein Hsp20 domain protein [Candidatus Magnetoovum chiemensis]|nr:Heat shock protein Hsp20 domain protein [Candidatus Magnetoovum chiemensis]
MKHKLNEYIFFNIESSKASPLMDIFETAELLVFEVDLPGIEAEDLSIRVYGDIVILEGIKKDSDKKGNCRYLCMERNRDNFRRMIKLPVKVDAKGAKAKYKDGVVRILFPKIKESVIKITIEKE